MTTPSSTDVHVAFAVDGKFIDLVAVAITSIIAHSTAPQRLRFYVLYDRRDNAVPERAARWSLSVPVEMVAIDNPFPQATGRITTAALYRTLLPDALAIDRVLYLDADIVVQRDIAELYATDLGGASVGGVVDAGMYLTMDREAARGYRDLRDYFLSMGFDATRKHYINSGMLLMDLDVLRRAHFTDDIVKAAIEFEGRLRTHDQCLINKVLFGRIALLDPRWNALANTVGRKRWHRYAGPELRTMIDQQGGDPWLIHFAGDEKPWSSQGLWRSDAWWRHASSTNISWVRPSGWPALVRARKRLRKWMQRALVPSATAGGAP